MTVTMLGGALTLLTTCSNNDDTKNADTTRPRPTTTDAPTTTHTPEEAKKQEVIAAREAADEAQIEALAPPSPKPDLPALAETHTGFMLDRMTQTADGLRVAGIASRLPEDTQHALEVESVRFETVNGEEVAYLEVCIVEDAERIDPQTGQILSSGVMTAQSAEAMKKVDGAWKLAERRQDSIDEGVTGCAVD